MHQAMIRQLHITWGTNLEEGANLTWGADVVWGSGQAAVGSTAIATTGEWAVTTAAMGAD